MPFTYVEDGSGVYRTPVLSWLFGRRLELCKDFINTGKLSLDIGTGSGVLLPFLCARFTYVVGVDIHGKLAITKEFLKSIGLSDHMDLIKASMENLPFKDRSIDTIACVSTLDHAQRLSVALEDMQRVATDRCNVVIGIHHDSVIFRILEIAIAVVSKFLFRKQYKDFKKDILNPHTPSQRCIHLIEQYMNVKGMRSISVLVKVYDVFQCNPIFKKVQQSSGR